MNPRRVQCCSGDDPKERFEERALAEKQRGLTKSEGFADFLSWKSFASSLESCSSFQPGSRVGFSTKRTCRGSI
eukprot:6201167-Pleurochrysis_carterae.AAC.5